MFKESCVVCFREISDPVCPDCYIQQVKMWVKHNGANEKVQEDFVEHLRRRFNFDTLNEEKCVLCFQGDVSVCYYCFFRRSTRLLENFSFPKETINNFRGVFNYHIMMDTLRLLKAQ